MQKCIEIQQFSSFFEKPQFWPQKASDEICCHIRRIIRQLWRKWWREHFQYSFCSIVQLASFTLKRCEYWTIDKKKYLYKKYERRKLIITCASIVETGIRVHAPRESRAFQTLLRKTSSSRRWILDERCCHLGTTFYSHPLPTIQPK